MFTNSLSKYSNLLKNPQKNTCYHPIKLALLFTATVLVARLLPHPANVSPLLVLALAGSSVLGQQYPRLKGLIILLCAVMLSDLGLSLCYGYAPFGSWTLFTYSGLAAIFMVGRQFLPAKPSLAWLVATPCCSLGFWIWSNFGVWVFGQGVPYTFDLTGLSACYAAALPFLQRSLLGDLGWLMFVAGVWCTYEVVAARRMHVVLGPEHV